MPAAQWTALMPATEKNISVFGHTHQRNTIHELTWIYSDVSNAVLIHLLSISLLISHPTIHSSAFVISHATSTTLIDQSSTIHHPLLHIWLSVSVIHPASTYVISKFQNQFLPIHICAVLQSCINVATLATSRPSVSTFANRPSTIHSSTLSNNHPPPTHVCHYQSSSIHPSTFATKSPIIHLPLHISVIISHPPSTFTFCHPSSTSYT